MLSPRTVNLSICSAAPHAHEDVCENPTSSKWFIASGNPFRINQQTERLQNLCIVSYFKLHLKLLTHCFQSPTLLFFSPFFNILFKPLLFLSTSAVITAIQFADACHNLYNQTKEIVPSFPLILDSDPHHKSCFHNMKIRIRIWMYVVNKSWHLVTGFFLHLLVRKMERN